MLILENGEILVEKNSSKKKKVIKKATKKVPKYVLTYNEDVYGNVVDINFGVFVEEFKDEKEHTKIKLRNGYSVLIRECECHANPIKGDAYVFGDLKSNCRLIDSTAFDGLCKRAMNANTAAEALHKLVQNYFVGREYDESEFYIVDDKKDNLWFFEGSLGESDDLDLIGYVETDKAYRISDTIGIATIYKGFDLATKSDFAYIDKKAFQKIAQEHTKIIKAYKDLRDLCKSYFE